MRFFNKTTLLNTLIGSIYSSSCLHCEGVSEGLVFCEKCQQLIELLNPIEHCPRCFLLLQEDFCARCHKRKIPYTKAAVFEKIGPIDSLLSFIEKGSLGIYLKSIASYMAMQYINLGWPCDFFTMAPLLKKPFSRFHVLNEIASHFFKITNLYFQKTMKLKRKGLWVYDIHISKPSAIYQKNVLLLALEPLKESIQALLKEKPKNLFVLSLFQDL